MAFLIESPELKLAREGVLDVSRAEEEFKVALRKRLGAAFKAAGGCARCGGRGWVVIWDTMDSLSGCYAKYGPCPAEGCTKESRERTGLNMGYYAIPYDRNRHVRFEILEHMTETERVEWTALQKTREIAEAHLITTEAGAYCAKGASVRVVRGRKVPRGTCGVVFWTGTDRFRGKPRVGFEARKGVVHWTAGSNLEMIEAAPGYEPSHNGSAWAREASYAAERRLSAARKAEEPMTPEREGENERLREEARDLRASRAVPAHTRLL